MNCAIAIATTGRPEIVSETVSWLLKHSQPSLRILVCGAEDTDVTPTFAEEYKGRVEFLKSEKGLTRQRNALFEACAEEDIVIFLDDDFLIEEGFVDVVSELFASNPEVVMATGKVLADGINGPGLNFEDGRAVLREHTTAEQCEISDTYNGYGCNMAVRMHPVREHNLRFDEKLPLYGWLEDVDFSRRLSDYGRIVRCTQMRGVHLGTKSGRTNGVRLGYSQIANPRYLISKKSMRTDRALTMMARNILSNTIRSVAPEPWVDRRGRLKGNLLAIADLTKGRLNPERVLNLQ